MPQSRTEIFTQIVNLLEPLSDQDKLNTVRAALVYFGQADAESVPPPSKSVNNGEAKEEAQGDDIKLSPQASRWLKQHNFQIDSLDTVFHWDGDVVDVIASDVPGTSKKEKTVHCYLVYGVKNLLQTGEAKFDDKHVRELCKMIGCYDSANHAAYVKSLGNSLIGKPPHYELTGPGLRAAAELLKSMVA